MKNLLSIRDMSRNEIERLFARADALRDTVLAPGGKMAALLFNMPSTRTLVSFEAALAQLGMGSTHLDYVFTQMVRGEDMRDTSRALGQYVSLIIARLSDHALLTTLAQNSPVPVINAATPLEHPCQILADLYTLRARRLLSPKTRFVFAGDPASNIANSLLAAAGLFGLSITFVVPQGYAALEPYARLCRNLVVEHELAKAVAGADVIYTHSWVHDTPAQESPERLRDFLPLQINKEALQRAPSAFILHPLPAFRGMEITSDVLDGRNSLVLEQSRNRLYVQKALVSLMLGMDQ